MAQVSTVQVLLATKNLFFTGRLKALAEPFGAKLVHVSSLKQVTERIGSPCPDLLVVDLSSVDNPDYGKLTELVARCPQTAVLAFGPHAQAHLLRRARAHGIDRVVPNSKLTEAFLQMLRTMSARGAGDTPPTSTPDQRTTSSGPKTP